MGRFGHARRAWLLPACLLLLAGLSLLPIGGEVARAHPLGNFTVNRFSRLHLTGQGVTVHYVVDMAEIPAFQAIRAIDTNGDGQTDPAEEQTYLERQVVALGDGLRLTVGGTPLQLSPRQSAISFPPGQAGLSTLRLEIDYGATWPDAVSTVDLRYADENFAGRLGWREIVITAGSGVVGLATDAPARSISDELRSYPQDALASPLNVSQVTARVQADPAAVPTDTPLDNVAVPAERILGNRVSDQFTYLIGLEQPSTALVLLSLLAALGFGAMHALGPGHGKTIVAAYLVGTRGTLRHAALLGATVTLTHTASVFALGGVSLLAARTVSPERLYPWLSLAAGVTVATVGLLLLVRRLRSVRRGYPGDAGHAHHHHADHTHTHTGEHHHGHGHAHPLPGMDDGITLRGLLALGVSGGLLPCPSALVVLLGAISLHRIGFGLLLIVAFSLGLATVLTGIGVMLLYSQRLAVALGVGRRTAKLPLVGNPRLRRHAPRLLPVGSALIITALGLIMTASALGNGHLI